MNIIKVFTTKGCEACNILNNILHDISDKIKYKIENIDCGNLEYKDFMKEHNITDFPTMCFIKDNKVVGKFIGTFSKQSILSMIDRFYNKL